MLGGQKTDKQTLIPSVTIVTPKKPQHLESFKNCFWIMHQHFLSKYWNNKCLFPDSAIKATKQNFIKVC